MTMEELETRIKNAILKVKKSYEAYSWILANDIDNIDSDGYVSHFSTVQELFSAVDILLRCFIIGKRIPVKPRGKKREIIVDETTDDIILETRAMCEAIVKYNRTNANDKYLTEVDFSYFIDASKKPRNMDEHLGKVCTLQDICRVYINLKKLCVAMDVEDPFGQSILEIGDSFDYTKFDACMNEMDETSRRFILIADSLHNVNQQQLKAFLQIPWSVIFDMDGTSDSGGLLSILLDDTYDGRSYTPYGFSDFDDESSSLSGNAVVDVCEGDIVPRKQDDRDKDRIRHILSTVQDSTHNNAIVVVTGNQTNRVRDFCMDIKAEFGNTAIIFLSSQKESGLIEMTDEDDRQEKGNICSVNVFPCSIFDAMKSIYGNRERFCGKATDSAVDGYVFNVKDGEQLFLPRNTLGKKEDSFEFLHLGVGTDANECNEWDFFHGDVANWATIKQDYVKSLANSSDFENMIASIKSAPRGSCYYIYHLPGFGGTTLGRLVAWKVHEVMPVVRLKKYDSSCNRLGADFGDMYTHLFDKNRFLVLVDESDIAPNDIKEVEKLIKDSEYKVLGLFVRRMTTETEASRMQKVNKENNIIVLSGLDVNCERSLQDRCLLLLKNRGDAKDFDKRKGNLEEIEWRHRYALLINLYLLEKNFKLDSYVGNFIKLLGTDSEEQRIKKMLAFVAMGDYFAGLKMPTSYISSYISPTDQNAEKMLDKWLDRFSGLLSKTKGINNNPCYKTKHFLIALEMLKQLLCKTHDEDWKKYLPDLVSEYIDFLCSIVRRTGKVDDVLSDAIARMFTDKTKSIWHTETGGESAGSEYASNFTSLLTAMVEYRRIDIINKVADVFGGCVKESIKRDKSRENYTVLAHIYAQRARIRSKCTKIDDDAEMQDNETRQYMSTAKKLMDEENIRLCDLEHMMGMCYLEMARRVADTDAVVSDDEVYENVMSDISNAIDRFDYATWYGSPEYGIPCKLDAITLAIRTITQKYGVELRTKKGLEKLMSIPLGNKYVVDGMDTVRDIDKHPLDPIDRMYAERKKDDFERVCFPCEPSRLLDRLDNISGDIDEEDYESRYLVNAMKIYAFEKKYRAAKDDRSSIIIKALGGDENAKKDANRVYSCLDSVIRMKDVHSVSFSMYNRWFEYAKYKEISLITAFQQAQIWKQAELSRSSGGDALRPYYYLFVIQLLRFVNGEDVSSDDVLRAKKDLMGQLHEGKSSRAVQDWYANRRNMGALYSKDWIDFGEVDDDENIKEVRGRILSVDDNGNGFIRITQPQRMSGWKNHYANMHVDTDTDVRFEQKKTNMFTQADSGRTIKLKVGFSYERMVASMNSIINRNIDGGRTKKAAE